MGFVLAQVNIGRLRAPLDSPQLAGFMAALDPVNAAADAAPGIRLAAADRGRQCDGRAAHSNGTRRAAWG